MGMYNPTRCPREQWLLTDQLIPDLDTVDDVIQQCNAPATGRPECGMRQNPLLLWQAGGSRNGALEPCLPLRHFYISPDY